MISGNEFTIQITWSGTSEGSRWLTLQPLDVVRETLEETLTSAPVAACGLTASTLVGAERPAFQAAMVLQACDGRTRFAESLFGWGERRFKGIF